MSVALAEHTGPWTADDVEALAMQAIMLVSRSTKAES